jgi:hypothetical protein
MVKLLKNPKSTARAKTQSRKITLKENFRALARNIS